MTIDVAALLRARKPEKRRGQLRVRPRSALTAASDIATTRPFGLVFDTNVYIHVAAGTLPTAAKALTDRALVFHCAVCLGELVLGLGNADPLRRGWQVMRRHYQELFASVRDSRVLTPDLGSWTDAGLIAGILARTQGFQPHQHRACLNDALIFLTAARAGLPVLTSNRDDFDLIQQLAPETRFVHY